MSWELAGAAFKLIMAGMEPVKGAPIARHGYWRIGGPADLLVDVDDETQLRAVMDIGHPVTVIGNGSNLLVADAGIRGIAIRLKGTFRDVQFRDPTQQGELDHLPGGVGLVIVGAGTMNTVLLSRLDKARLGGLGCLAGVPGTIGGAIRMNAGTRLGEIGTKIAFVRIMQPDGEVVNLTPDDIEFTYRRATLPEDAIVIRVGLWVAADVYETEKAAMVEHLDYRKQTQPLDQPSCGSTFKNPPGDHAGRLIEAAGLKGATAGGAQISEKHANFIVNTGDATAHDVYTLIQRAREEVQTQFGITLEPEVHAIGDWPEGLWPL